VCTFFSSPTVSITLDAAEEIAEDQKKAERAEKMKGVEKIEYEDEDPDMVMTYNDKTGEFSGPRGPEPTRHGDYSFKGRCSDF
jgi:hypothetical protein